MSLMNCPECGREVSSIATSCPNCGYPLQTAVQEIEPQQAEQPEVDVPMDDFLTKPILYAIFFSGAFGAPAIVCAARAGMMAKKGKQEESNLLKRISDRWCKVSMWVGIGGYIYLTLYLILICCLPFFVRG